MRSDVIMLIDEIRQGQLSRHEAMDDLNHIFADFYGYRDQPTRRRTTSRRRSAPRKTMKKTRTLSKWQKYVKNKKTQIKYKSGKDKGKLNLKAMGRAYRKKNK